MDNEYVDSWEARAAEAEALAGDVGASGADARLIALLLDPDNSAVTFRTAVALLNQRDPRAVRLVVFASSSADDRTNDWIGDAFREVRSKSDGADNEFLRRALEAVHDDPDASCARAAREWTAWCGFA